MNNVFKTLKKNPLIKAVASIKITVTCLSLLFILTFWGTVAQVTEGLYLAQEKFFNSWYFLVFDFIPFPGAQLILWVLFFNLLAVSTTRFVYRWSHIGILVIHMGLLSYFVSAFVTLHCVQEANISFFEGESSNVSVTYHEWEISVWEQLNTDTKKVLAYDSDTLKSGDVLSFQPLGIDLSVRLYFSNAKAYTQAMADKENPKNVSGISELSKEEYNTEPEKNFPGVVFGLNHEGKKVDEVLLFGQESQPTQIKVGDTILNFQLRRKRYELPITMKLKKFVMEKHPGTETPKSFRSFVEVDHKGIKRDVEVYMNHPYRFKDYTFYQASYSIDSMGRMGSTLAVVKNFGRLLPYISSLLTFAGLMIHFLMMAFKRRKR